MKIKTLLIGVGMSMGLFSFGQHISDTTTTELRDSDVQLFAPNAFTPDGDSFNDTWKIYIEGIDIYDFHAVIFDSQGQIIWESFNTAGEWDGTYGGYELAPDGVYPYYIETKDAVTDKRYKFTGFITVLR